MKAYFAAAAGAAALGLACGAAHAATLTMDATADNQFAIYVSSSDSVLGTLVLTGADWGTTYSASVNLTSATEFIHVIAINWTTNTGWPQYGQGNALGNGTNPTAFIGTFNLVGGAFANGSTTLSTGTTYWTGDGAYPLGTPPWTQTTLPVWSTPTDTPITYGSNGDGPWGLHGSIAADAQWIWSNSTTNYDYAEFSTQLTDVVPEASTWTMLLSGFGALALASVWSAKRRPRTLEA